MLLSLTIIGVGGCGATTPTSSPATSTTQSSTATPAASASSNQPNQGQTAQKQNQNPAFKATMDISRLQRDQQNALTSDQKAKIEPILQELISTPNPSQDILQQKADAINIVFTDQQKTFLATPRTANGNKQNTNTANGNKPQGETGSNHTGSAPNPQTMYQQVLDSLKKYFKGLCATMDAIIKILDFFCMLRKKA